MLQGYWPGTMNGNIVINPHTRGMFLTRLYSRYGTFSEIQRDKNGQGHIVNSGKSEIPLQKHMYYLERYELPSKYLYINGEKRTYHIDIKLDFWRCFCFNKFKVEAIPDK